MRSGWEKCAWAVGAGCLVGSSLFGQAGVGAGAPNGAQQAFITAWNRNGFNLLVGPPSGGVTSYGTTGLIQQFPSVSSSQAMLALIKPDTTANLNVQQVLAPMFAYYTEVGVGTAGFPTQDTMTCPLFASLANNPCEWQLFSKDYALFTFPSPLANGSQNFATRDPFYTKWISFNGVFSFGPATSDETMVTSSFGTTATLQTYAAGAIYSITSGLFNGKLIEVVPPAYSLYVSRGSEGGQLGLPTSEPLVQPDGTFIQNFEGGAIQYNTKTGSAVLLPAINSLVLTPAGPVHLAAGDTLAVQATLYDSSGDSLPGRSVAWNTSNGSIVAIQANGYSATLKAAGAGTAQITATAGGKTSPALSVTVAAVCCQIGQGAPTVAIQQAIQTAVTRNSLTVQLPAPSGVTRLGNGYVQQLTGAGSNVGSYLVAVADGSAAAYVVGGAILTEYLALGGPAGALGYPLSDETPGGRQAFANGTLAGTPVQLVTGAILAKWAALGYETGSAGSPTGAVSAFLSFRGTAGNMQPFQNALIVAATSGPLAGQTYAVGGLILAQYSAGGGPGGNLGAPTGDAATVNGLQQQNFEGGFINYAPGSAAANVTTTPRQPLVTTTPAAVLSGSVVNLVAGGFNNGATVRVSQTGQPDFLVQVANGVYTWNVQVPAAAASGAVTVRA
ncbi:MAG: hypothetical protein JOZ22_17020, partial [Acidobacteriia bacterium]|nr:hypothetical protein [Terriglobia bacterium]